MLLRTGTHAHLTRPAAGRQPAARTCHAPSSSSGARRRRAVAAAAASTAPGPGDLRQLLLAKERELASLFESGRPMPAAAVVAALRAEIAALDDQLNGRPGQPYVPAPPRGPNANGAPAGARPGAAGVGSSNFQSPSYVAPPSPATAAAMRTRTEQLADKAYEMVQQQLQGGAPVPAPPSNAPFAGLPYVPPAAPAAPADPGAAAAAAYYNSPAANVTYDAAYGANTAGAASASVPPSYAAASPAPGGGYAASPSSYVPPPPAPRAPQPSVVPGRTMEDTELARLEAENSTLRAQAYGLLQRQQQLETMVAEVQGTKPPELLLETTEQMLARMKAKLQKQQA